MDDFTFAPLEKNMHFSERQYEVEVEALKKISEIVSNIGDISIIPHKKELTKSYQKICSIKPEEKEYKVNSKVF